MYPVHLVALFRHDVAQDLLPLCAQVLAVAYLQPISADHVYGLDVADHGVWRFGQHN